MTDREKVATQIMSAFIRESMFHPADITSLSKDLSEKQRKANIRYYVKLSYEIADEILGC